MSNFGLGTTSPRALAHAKDFVPQYKHLRKTRLRLNEQLTGRLSKEAIDEGARKLGMMSGKTIVFNTDDETSVLMDYCIYNVYRNGRNAVDQYLCDFPPEPDSDEMTCLQAMQHATFGIIAVRAVMRGVGCLVREFYSQQDLVLFDYSFSTTAVPGAVLITRLLDFGDYVTTSGTALPVGVVPVAELAEMQREINQGTDDPSADPAPLIRSCLEEGMSANIAYDEPGRKVRRGSQRGNTPRTHVEDPSKRRRELDSRKSKSAAGNRRCRCGSGKMFKNCCGKHPSDSAQ